MKAIVIGDYDTLVGTPEKPGKVVWLRENGIQVDGVQIISLADDLLPRNLENFGQKMTDLIEKVPGLERISVAILCWPHKKIFDDSKNVVDVAVTNTLETDFYTPTLFICKALQEIHDQFGISVDISYHPMLTIPTRLFSQLDPAFHQKFLWECEKTRRKELMELLLHYGILDVGINIENEPITSDAWGTLTHMSNRLFSEQVNDLQGGYGVTADLQHCAMMINLLQSRQYGKLFPPLNDPFDRSLWTWEGQFNYIRRVHGSITFHVAQMADPMRHITPPIMFDNPIMDWPLILRLMKKLDEFRGGNVWYAVEQDGGHVFPEGYKMDLAAFQYLQEYFRRT